LSQSNLGVVGLLMRTAIALILATLSWSASAQTGQEQNSGNCEWFLKNRPKLDAKFVAVFLGQYHLTEIEEMNVWLDRYCPEHRREHLASAMRKGLKLSKPR
jgi:hypothetical protein